MAGYNQKIVRTNSYVEIWEYEKPIFNKDKFIEVSDSIIKKENSKRKTFDELTTEEQNKRLERMSKTRLEAKWKLLRLVDCNFDDKTSFLTLTTKKNIEDRNEFTSLLKTFIKRFNYNIFNTKKSELKYLTVLERQKRNAWHAHIFDPMVQLRVDQMLQLSRRVAFLSLDTCLDEECVGVDPCLLKRQFETVVFGC